ncbi:GNAT family N-acetyltransferase [Wenxinia saemankumensis]|uniref:Phosphinothricin acetyltransferase n=1 Tax=Wenxinia saemankumensis TaxID=1447782 RepID=A0A1M6APY2_9RHOB|nr:GNAT family N-acetyltransferase [Wenxinia saemankumensis]SHI38564.1 phosphinothricin acetyltransferase [Wenxinia saemankumensis]
MIRRAGPGDAGAVAAIWNHYIRETIVTFLPDEKTEEDVRRAMGADHGFWVAGDPAIGFARCFPFRSGRGYARTAEHTVLLSPGQGGRGLGRALMAALQDDARHRGIHALMAGVSGENAAGLAFHRAIGFHEVARLPRVGWKFDRPHDLLLLQKFL